jgi:hypothetical protein
MIGALGGGTDGPVPERTESALGASVLWNNSRAQ